MSFFTKAPRNIASLLRWPGSAQQHHQHAHKLGFTARSLSIRTTTRSLPSSHLPRFPVRRSPTTQIRQYRQPFNYQRFSQSQSLLRRWASSRYFYYQVAGIGVVIGVYYTSNLEDVPISGRRRFRNISYETEEQMGQQAYQQVMQQYQGQLLSPNHPAYKMVQRVAKRLIPHSGLNQQWEVYVVKDPEANAFVIPGGKIFVLSGILDVARTDDQLAAVLAHEISHNVAHHSAERASSASILMVFGWLLYGLTGVDVGITNVLLDVAFSKPNSRTQESEADYLGLLMMAQACYDPEAAVDLWKRMNERDQHQIPQFLSTHPSDTSRVAQMSEWLPKAEIEREKSGCETTRHHAVDFMQALTLR